MDQQLTTHLIDLRNRLIYSLLGIAIVFVLLMPWANELYNLIALPLRKTLPPSSQIIATEVIAPFFIPVKLTALVAFTISLPHSMYQIWKFVAPGLYKQEQKLASGVIISGFLLFLSGILFCYFLVLPALFHFIFDFKLEQIPILADMSKYMDLVISLSVIFGISFEMPLIIFLLIRLEIISIQTAQNARKYVFVLAFIIAAIITPPDVVSQIMLAIPLYLLYELGIFIARLVLYTK